MEPRHDFLFIGPLPPPVNGFTSITEKVLGRILGIAEPEIVNVSTAPASGGFSRVRVCVWKMLFPLFAILKFRLRGGSKIYIACNGGFGVLYNLFQIGVARALRCSVLLHHHSYSYINSGFFPMKALVYIGGARLRHIFLSDAMASDFQAQNGPCKFFVLDNLLFVPNKASGTVRRARHTLTLGHMGNLTAEKGLDDFLALVESCINSGIDVDAVLAGPTDAYGHRVITEAHRRLPEKILYAGPVYGQAKEAFFESIDVFVFPTKYKNEAQPLVIYESHAAGKPVITFDRGCIRSQLGADDLLIQSDQVFCSVAMGWIAHLAGLLVEDASGKVLEEISLRISADYQLRVSAALDQFYECFGTVVQSQLTCPPEVPSP